MIDYELIDSGNLKKLERFGSNLIMRPCPIAIWKPKLDKKVWDKADFIFSRDKKNQWINKKGKKTSFDIEIHKIKLKLRLTDFGHIGFFPEHLFLCQKIEKNLSKHKNKNILNLFAYTGLATFFAAKTGAKVTHVDSSKPTTQWAKENASLNPSLGSNIRWIVDDAIKFLKREIKRKNKYDGIILDPPSFGRGVKGEVFKIEDKIFELLDLCKNLLSKNFLFLIFSCHTPGFTKTVLQNITEEFWKKEKFLIEELKIDSKNSFSLPSGFYVYLERP